MLRKCSNINSSSNGVLTDVVGLTWIATRGTSLESILLSPEDRDEEKTTIHLKMLEFEIFGAKIAIKTLWDIKSKSSSVIGSDFMRYVVSVMKEYFRKHRLQLIHIDLIGAGSVNGSVDTHGQRWKNILINTCFDKSVKYQLQPDL
ncbi:hypothetical protein SK128_019114 [Halocaridina rubra]|uniref:Uncharacterized protein n=1 Tax=Halocaridina rubra TaxID=373956 RepID=A0AAN9FTP2_HALRR